jgi:endonuclease/exonuclease/phosphatase family metal-dependent hydrolase
LARRFKILSMKPVYTALAIFVFFSCSPRLKSSNSTAELRVMSYNIHHANPPSKADLIDLQAVANVIKSAKADVVALQEVDVHTTRSGIGINQAEELGKLTGMKAYFARAIDYGGGEYGVAVLSRFPMSETSNTPLPTIESTKGEHRTLGKVTLAVPGGKQVVFAFTHLDAQRTDTNRLLQARRINELLAAEKRPVILAGDLNATAGTPVIDILDKQFTRSCINNCGFTIPQVNPTKTIDFIAFAPAGAFTVLSHEVIAEKYASDHRPVLAVLKW